MGTVRTEQDEEDDRQHPVLGKRITASKPARLVIAEKAKGKNASAELVKVLEKHARELSNEFACVGIIVNRVKTARELCKKMGGDHYSHCVFRVCGKMGGDHYSHCVCARSAARWDKK